METALIVILILVLVAVSLMWYTANDNLTKSRNTICLTRLELSNAKEIYQKARGLMLDGSISIYNQYIIEKDEVMHKVYVLRLGTMYDGSSIAVVAREYNYLDETLDYVMNCAEELRDKLNENI